MSKVGRKVIDTTGVEITIDGKNIAYKGAKDSGVYLLPEGVHAELEDNQLKLVLDSKKSDAKALWGLHRALLANKITGVSRGFERKLQINGLGYKAQLAGNEIIFSLGYSHKINVALPEGVTFEVDKSGQNLVFKGVDKQILGDLCGKIRALRPPEPYKATGIKFVEETIRRKAGKAKSA